MIVDRAEAERIYTHRENELVIPKGRRVPGMNSVVPIGYREPNPALGYDAFGEPRRQVIRVCYIIVLEVWWDEEERGTKIRFVMDPRHKPRLLSSAILAGRQGAYVDHPARALSDEPEAVDPFFQDRLTREARERDELREANRRQARNDLPFGDQLILLESEARSRYVDIRSELRAARRFRKPAQLIAIRRKLDRDVVSSDAG